MGIVAWAVGGLACIALSGVLFRWKLKITGVYVLLVAGWCFAQSLLTSIEEVGR